MHVIVMQDEPDRRRWVLVGEPGDEVVAELTTFAERERVRAAHFTALGAFRSATLAYFDWEAKAYLEIPVAEQVEVTSLVGDIGVADDGAAIHAHAVLGRRDGSALTGHLLRGTVRPTLEVFVEEGAGTLRRRPDAETGLALIRPEA